MGGLLGLCQRGSDENTNGPGPGDRAVLRDDERATVGVVAAVFGRVCARFQNHITGLYAPYGTVTGASLGPNIVG